MRLVQKGILAVLGLMSISLQVQAGTWTKLTNLAPGGGNTMLLLSDGRVMALNNSNLQSWMFLKPDANGSYINGTWSASAPMSTRRLYFTSNLLPNGRLWVMGGEYSGVSLFSNWSPTAEIYNPLTNTWTNAATYPPQASGCPNNVTVDFPATTTSGSNVVTGIANTGQLAAGMSVQGTGIPSGATIASVLSVNQLQLSANATSTGTNTLVFIGNPAACFGDVPSSMLSGGRILAGNLGNTSTKIYNWQTDTWSSGGTKVYDRSDEEGWVKLPNGNILTYDLFASYQTNGAYAEMYNPLTNIWSSISPSDGGATGTIPQLSSSALGAELGPILRLQDGRVLFIGATNHTAFYNPTTNTWSAGPDITGTLNGNPAAFGADDATAAILPNGHVLFTADAGPSPTVTTGTLSSGSNSITNVSNVANLQLGWGVSGPGIPNNTRIAGISGSTVTINQNATANGIQTLTFGGIFSAPTQMFDFNPATNAISVVASPGTNLPTIPAYITRMLMLPNGQLLFSDSSNQFWAYTPDPGILASARPVVNNVAYTAPGEFTLTGKQINGQSAGSSYGDDVQNDSNYPIVRLTNSAGKVFYCRTYNWSSVDIPSGVGTVNFSLNTAVNTTLVPGNYILTLSGAGLQSAPTVITITAAQIAGA